jgi:hypothetical protein
MTGAPKHNSNTTRRHYKDITDRCYCSRHNKESKLTTSRGSIDAAEFCCEGPVAPALASRSSAERGHFGRKKDSMNMLNKRNIKVRTSHRQGKPIFALLSLT